MTHTHTYIYIYFFFFHSSPDTLLKWQKRHYKIKLNKGQKHRARGEQVALNFGTFRAGRGAIVIWNVKGTRDSAHRWIQQKKLIYTSRTQGKLKPRDPRRKVIRSMVWNGGYFKAYQWNQLASHTHNAFLCPPSLLLCPFLNICRKRHNRIQHTIPIFLRQPHKVKEKRGIKWNAED